MRNVSKDALRASIIQAIELQERDIAELNEKVLKGLILKTKLLGKQEVDPEEKFEIYNRILRTRIITRLKETGSTKEVRREHIEFFEHDISTTRKVKFLLFSFNKKKSTRELWEETKRKLSTTSSFSGETGEIYRNYAKRIEEGFDEYLKWFDLDPGMAHFKLISERLLSLGTEGCAVFTNTQGIRSVLSSMTSVRLQLRPDEVSNMRVLEWVLTDTSHRIYKQVIEPSKQEVYWALWNPGNVENCAEYVCRILHEYFYLSPNDVIIDKTLIRES